MEIELKILLTSAAAAAIERSGGLRGARKLTPRPQDLTSIYFDTPDRRLAGAGAALRVRKIGRGWVQTIKRAKTRIQAGLSMPEELEFPVRSASPVLEGESDDGLLAETRALIGERPILPVFETRMKRDLYALALAEGEVEIALDRGEVVAGESRAPLHELEIELKSGGVGAIYDAAGQLFPNGPVRFSTLSKAQRGFLLADTGEVVRPPRPRHARKPALAADTTVEDAARDVLRDCLDQIAANMAVVAESDDPEGPHQLRIGLRRLRTALKLFAPDLGAEAVGPFRHRARNLGRAVGALRDRDVLLTEIIPRHLASCPDGLSRLRLVDQQQEVRRAIRAALIAELAGREAVHLLFDLGRLIETRAWLDPADREQNVRLDRPVSDRAREILDRQLARVLKRGKPLARLSIEKRHELRKQIKALRYGVEFFASLYGGKRARRFLRALKGLQECFGTLNDASMVEELLLGTDAEGRDDPALQRATGFLLGHLNAAMEREQSEFAARWTAFRDQKPYWR